MLHFLSTWVAAITYFLYFSYIFLEKKKYIKDIFSIMYSLSLSVLICGIIITNFYMKLPFGIRIPVDIFTHIIPFIIVHSLRSDKDVDKKYQIFLYMILGIMYRMSYDPLKHYRNTPWYIVYIFFPSLVGILSFCLGP